MHQTITVQELKQLREDERVIFDIRDELSYQYGNIKGSINITPERLYETFADYKDKKLIVYCKKGETSKEVTGHLDELGAQNVYDLQGGYVSWILDLGNGPEKTDDLCASGGTEDYARKVELSITKTFKKTIWSKFTKAINDYELIQENDKIAVCISGGKDSMLMAKLFQELKRHTKFPFEVVYLVMNPGYSDENMQIIENNAKRLNIPIQVFTSNIFDAVYEIDKSPCYLCARMRRGHLYHYAEELGCNKIALGHHYDDVIETILMGMLYGGQVQTMMPKLHSTNFNGMELIRPMYLIRENSIKAWRDYNQLGFIQCACHFTDTCTTCDADGHVASKRMETKKLIAELKKTNPFVETNIFRSVENVNLNTIISYKENGVKHHFLDDYDAQDL